MTTITQLRNLETAAGLDLRILDIQNYIEHNQNPNIIYDINGEGRYAWNLGSTEQRAFFTAAMEALPALLECAEALQQLLDDLGQLTPVEPSIQAVEEARAALAALAALSTEVNT